MDTSGQSKPSQPAAIEVRVEQADFNVAAELAAVRERAGAQVGGYASFVGLVRGSDNPDLTLTLEHYPGMTERSIEAIAAQACTRWQVLDLVVIHRVGRLSVGEQIVFVGVASGHRPDAFAACEFVMDYLKTDAVFWKLEEDASGRRWIDSTDSDQRRQQRWR
ncbi:MAG: molybdenum cofactor biosynthesis protein MoaE [Pseudomonadaceae bacterium]|nr:molybdenum cofactor biosynthesis protein MoaE [Pseudomonadaceae bacterium]